MAAKAGRRGIAEPVLPKALTRFRMPWQWNGGPAVLQSRSTDESGYVQPSREELIARRGDRGGFHDNMLTSWGVSASRRGKKCLCVTSHCPPPSR